MLNNNNKKMQLTETYLLKWASQFTSKENLSLETARLGTKQKLTCSVKWFKIPWNDGSPEQRTISAQDLSVNQPEAGFGNLFSRATPPVNRNRHSCSSILPLEKMKQQYLHMRVIDNLKIKEYILTATSRPTIYESMTWSLELVYLSRELKFPQIIYI